MSAAKWLEALARRAKTEIKRDPDAVYMGVYAVQAPGAWTRIGPTWHSKRYGWLCVGVGVKYWRTNAGLGELVVNPDVRPEWHAEAVTWAPQPNLAFAATDDVVKAHKPVLELMKALANVGIKT